MIYPIFVFLAVLFTLFLFWRAARYELFSSQEALDLTVVSILGAGVFARIFDFIFKTAPSDWSISTFVFFNRYGGFDFWGALLGIAVALAVFERGKGQRLFAVLDLLAAPLVFGQMIVSLGSYLSEPFLTFGSLSLYYFLGYFLIFLAIKRLWAKKRNVGFFFSFYLFCILVLEIAMYRFKTDINYIGSLPYELVAPLAILALALFNWYLLSKRNLAFDFKKISALVLLSIFRFMRILTSVDEAGKLSRSLMFFPYYVLRTTFVVILILGREIKLAFLELMYVFG